MKDQALKERMFGIVELCSDSAAIEFNGVKYTPDATRAYSTFQCSRGFPAQTAYGTCSHPGTVANSYGSMRHQMVNYNHEMKIRNPAGKNDIREDRLLGTVLDVTFPKAPTGGWKVASDADKAPSMQGIMVIHKAASKAKEVLGEHLAGRHKWTVSIEFNYSLLQSGFVIGDRAKATKGQEALMAEDTPDDLGDLGYGYVTVENAPEDLLNCFSTDKRRIVGTWNKLPVSLMKGGINGEGHYDGLGIVKYGAERQAEIQQILASDPDRLEAVLSGEESGLGYHRRFTQSFADWIEALK